MINKFPTIFINSLSCAVATKVNYIIDVIVVIIIEIHARRRFQLNQHIPIDHRE